MTVVAFDVDGTLIYQVGERVDTPRDEVIAAFHALEALGCVMVIWSGGGCEYADYWRNKLGLKAMIMPKLKSSFVPDITFDDLEITLGKVNIRV